MYDNDKIYTITLPEWDFGDGNTVDKVGAKLPPGYKGDLIGIGVRVTETFAVDTTAAILKVGTAADDNAYAQLEIADATADTAFFDQTDDTDAIIAHTTEGQIAAAEEFLIEGVAGADAGTAAGKGIPELVFRIWK